MYGREFKKNFLVDNCQSSWPLKVKGINFICPRIFRIMKRECKNTFPGFFSREY